jgi:hypothetical protein
MNAHEIFDMQLQDDHVRIVIDNDDVTVASDCGCSADLTRDEIERLFNALNAFRATHP